MEVKRYNVMVALVGANTARKVVLYHYGHSYAQRHKFKEISVCAMCDKSVVLKGKG